MKHDDLPPTPAAVPPDVKHTNQSLLTHVRHELRAPVNAIIGYSEMLLKDAANLTHQRFFADLQHVHSVGRQLLALLTDYLEAARDPGMASDLDVRALGASVRQLLHIPSNEVIDSCDSLLSQAEQLGLEEFIPDLQRIRAAGVSLFALNDEVLDFGKRVPESAGSADDPLSGVAAGAAGAGSGGHILVADDNAFNRDILARCLYRHGHHFALAHNGRQALDLVAAHAFDLLLLDIMMPEMNGIQVLEHLKADPVLRQVPVLIMAALDEIDGVVRCLQMGADDYLPKPFNPVLFKARIDGCLEKKRLRDRERLHLEQLRQEQERADAALRAALPEGVADELKTTSGAPPRRYEAVAVLVADVAGFTAYCDRHAPEEAVGALDQLVAAWEDLVSRHGVRKIKTAGDAFVAAAGLGAPADNPVLECVRCGLAMIEAARQLPVRWDVRVGIHDGPVVAGLVGRRPCVFDLWGDTVDLAAWLKDHAPAGGVVLSGAAWQQIGRQCRGTPLEAVEAKGKGKLEVVRFDGFRS